MARTPILLLIFVFLSVTSFTQYDDLISVKHQKRDFKQLVKAIEAHPDPYRYTNEDKFISIRDSIGKTLLKPDTRLNLYKKFSALIALIRDGHTSLRMSGNDVLKQAKFKGVFPYEVIVTEENEFYVIKKAIDSGIPVGAKIISINGLASHSLISNVDQYISYELKAFRNIIIGENIEFYLYLAFGQSENLILKYKYAGKIDSTISANITHKEYKKYKKANKDQRQKRIDIKSPYDFQILGNGVGLIKIYQFSANIKNYNLFLLKTFKKIRKENIHSIIIDVRDNLGGWPKLSSELFHYIHNGYFKSLAKSETKVSQPYKDHFSYLPYYLKSNTQYFTNRLHYVNVADILDYNVNSIIEESDFFNETPITEEYEFYGDSYLLTNHKSFSAASCFAATFKCYEIGKIIGEHTGGTKIFRANAISIELAKSNFILGVSTAKNYSACYNNEDEPVYPHIEVKSTINELVHDVDAQLNYTLQFIKKLQKVRNIK